MSKRETKYQQELVARIKMRLPGCEVIKNNPDHIQGIPDLLILYNDRWGMLEVKIDGNAGIRPNQLYYVDHFNEMSFAAFIYPEIEEEVLNALQSKIGNIG